MNVRGVMCVMGAVLAGASSATLADQVVLEYNEIYSGTTGPVGGAPFGTATFTSNAAGTVSLHLQAHLATPEFFSKFFFNFDPSLDITKLSVAHAGGVVPGSMAIGANAHKAGGGGKYDININFPTSAANRFNGTDEAWFTFTSSQAITAASFNFIGAPHGGQGPFLTAAHVQGLGARANDSAWVFGEERQQPQTVVVPIPAAAWMGLPALAGVGMAGVARRKRFGR